MSTSNYGIIIIWPKAFELEYQSYIECEIQKCFKVVYKNVVEFSDFEEFLSFCMYIYIRESWIISSGFNALEHKAKMCFSNDNKIAYYVVEYCDVHDLMDIKEQIRSKCDVGKHSVHTTDNIEQFRYVSMIINLFELKKARLLKHRTEWGGVLKEIKEREIILFE